MSPSLVTVMLPDPSGPSLCANTAVELTPGATIEPVTSSVTVPAVAPAVLSGMAAAADDCGAAERRCIEAPAAAEALRNEADRIIAHRDDVADLGVIDIAAVAAADALQQCAVGAVAGCEDRAIEIDRDRSRVAGSAAIAEHAVGIAAAAAKALRDDADRAVAIGHDVAGLRIIDGAAIAAANRLQQGAVGAVAGGEDRAIESEPDRSRVAGSAGIAERIGGKSAAPAKALRDDPDRPIAGGHDAAVLGVVDRAAIAAADRLQQNAVRAIAHGPHRSGKVECDGPAIAGSARVAERAVGISAAAAEALRDDSDGAVAPVITSPVCV